MVERRRRPEISPRWLTIGEVAQYLGHSPSWLTPERLARLKETGFPMVDPSLERIDREAIDDWCDRRSGRQGASAAPDDLAPTHPGDAPSADAASDPWVKAAHELRDAKARN
jgi:excisionase family DNA binding protein